MSDVTTAKAGSHSWLRRHGAKLALSLVVAGTFGWLLHAGGLPVLPPRKAFETFQWWTVAVYVPLWCGVHLVRAARWKFLLDPVEPVPMKRILGVSFIGFAAIAFLPLRTGEAVRPLLIRKRGLSGWAATGTIAAERIIDGLVLTLMLLIGLSTSTPQSPLPDRIGDLPISPSIVPRAAYSALVLFGSAFLVMGIFYAQRVWARRVTERILGIVSPNLARWVADKLEHVADGLRFLPNLRYSVPFIGATALYWTMNSAGIQLVAHGAGFDHLTFSEACVLMGVVALGILVPNAPGFFGAYQLSFYAALAVFYPTDQVVGAGAACVLVVYTAQLVITLLGAVVGFLLERTSVSDALAASEAPEEAPGPAGGG